LSGLRLWAVRARQLKDIATAAPFGQASAAAEQDQPAHKPRGWTAKELCDEAVISEDTFKRIREAAGIKKAARGGGGAQRRFNRLDVMDLIGAVMTSRQPEFRKREKIAGSWRDLVNPQ
jgi:hypothetical protein